jgi:simple sugar transport system permease protein
VDVALLTSIVTAAVRAGTALLLPALGEILTERAGVLNLGLEGLMLVGALTGFAVTAGTGGVPAGLVAAAVAGGLLALVHAVTSVTLRANQVVSGLALVFLATGVTDLFGRRFVGRTVEGLAPVPVPGLGDLPGIGPALFRHDVIVYAGYLLVAALWYVLYHTRLGLHLRAVGESPETADAMGVSVAATRYGATVAGGMLAGLGGAYLSIGYTHLWVSQMSAGRGWIALALVIFAGWSPVRALFGAVLFGGVDALQFRLQAAGSAVPGHLLLMLPYLATLAVLALASTAHARQRLGVPSALGLPYAREERR